MFGVKKGLSVLLFNSVLVLEIIQWRIGLMNTEILLKGFKNFVRYL